MDKEKLLEKLKKHRTEVENQIGELYVMRMNKTIEQLEEDYYKDKDEELITDLQSLGFPDLAKQVRIGMYV